MKEFFKFFVNRFFSFFCCAHLLNTTNQKKTRGVTQGLRRKLELHGTQSCDGELV